MEPFSFQTFGGVRLDVPEDQVGAEEAIYARDVIWDRSLGKVRSRDGFAWLKEAEATGEYKALFPHSSLRILATKRVSAESLKLVAIDREGAEKKEATLKATAAKSSWMHFGTPSAEYTYMRTNTSEQKVVRFNGTTFTEPTATVDGEASKEMPKAALMATWPGEYRAVFANTGTEGGPNKKASSTSHVWFSEPGSAEKFESTAYVQLNPGDGEEIVALCAYGSRVFVFKETKFFVFYAVGTDAEGKPEFLFNEVSLGQGARMKRATSELLEETSDQLAVAAVDGVYFCTTDGIYVTTGGEPSKISEALHPLEETTSFEGPMAEALDGENESFRWPATGIETIGHYLYVRRYEWMWIYDLSLDAWVPWKIPATSFAVWTGLTGGGSDASEAANPAEVGEQEGEGVEWENGTNAKSSDNKYATVSLEAGETSEWLPLLNFGELVPEGNIVKGIKVEVEGLQSDRLDGALWFQPVKGGTREGTELGNPLETTEEIIPISNSGELWGLAWTAADFGGEFGFAVRAETFGGACEFKIDTAIVTVYSTPTTGVRPRLFVAKGKHVYYTEPGAEDNEGSRAAAWQSGRYDLDTPEEKTLYEAAMWGTGTVKVAVAKDFGKAGEAKTFELSEDESEPARHQRQLTQQGTLFSHRFSGTAPWSVHRFTRWADSEKGPASNS